MRLVCPNCGAQYEVDDRVIPEGGRDVQCSACGHGWYQMPSDHEEASHPEPEVDEQLSPEEHEEAERDEDLPGEADETTGEEDEGTPPAVAAKPREIDEGVRSILREEADRELSARAAEPKHEPEQVETQPDLGLDSGPSPEEERRRIARERMARMRGIDEEELPEPDFDAHAEAQAEPEKPSQGRDLFPDIEEINSTLDSHAPTVATGAGAVEVERESRRGFGRGFMLVVTLAALLMTLYIVAPRLAVSVPALEPALSAYVAAIDSARLWLDGVLSGLVSKIEEAAGQGG